MKIFAIRDECCPEANDMRIAREYLLFLSNYGYIIHTSGDTRMEEKYSLNTIIADESAIGMINQKTTAVRIIPVIGKEVGDTVEFGGLLGYAPIMPVNESCCERFVTRGGRIPAPIHSFKNQDDSIVL